MYKFIDTTEAYEGAILPSEALQINGKYIENIIPGYRTLHVSGREALAPELETYETGIRDGSTLKNRRYPARVITVTYQLIAESAEAFRRAYNTLGGLLDVEEAELIFNDEPDVYFKGTLQSIGEVEPGKNAVIGEIEFFCADPFKYSVIEYEAEPWEEDKSMILIDYNGTYRAFPTLEAEFMNETEVADDGETAGTLTGNGECGYVAFFNERERIIQLGDPDEKDGNDTAYAKSQTLLNQTYKTTTAWGSAAQNLWAKNSGVVLPSGLVQAGSLAMGVASYTSVSTPANTSGTLLKVTSKANKPVMHHTVTAKATNRTANSVKVTFAITTALDKSENFFGKGYSMKAHIYVAGAWREVTMKTTSERWEGKSGHTKNIAVTITGLSASTTSITGMKFKVTRPDGLGTAGQLGETACSDLKISAYPTPEPETYYLAPSSYGSASGKYHGPAITRTLPADASGATGAANFTMTWKQKMSIGSASSATNERGAFQCMLSDASGKVIAGVRILKSAAGKAATLVFYVNGKQVYSASIDLSYNNKYFGNKETAVQTSKITKSGKTVTFAIAGTTKSFNDSAIASTAVTKVTFMFEQYSTNSALSYNGLYWAKFVKDNCETWKDIPNKFSANDVVTADCKAGKIYLNGVNAPELGALGNDWETFYLVPGLNAIGFAYSEWVTAECAPSFRVRYREVFL